MRASDRKGWRLIALPLLALASLAGSAQAADAPDDRLRTQLRETTLELRAAQDELATLRSQQAGLKVQAEAAAPPKPAAAAVDAKAQRRLKEQDAQIAELINQLEGTKRSLAKWQEAYQQAADVARTRDTDLKALQAEHEQSTAFAQSCAAKNRQLVEIGKQLLDRYQNKGVFAGLLDAEPFTQIHRVKLEEQVQDYQGRIKDNTQGPAEAGPEVPPPPTQ